MADASSNLKADVELSLDLYAPDPAHGPRPSDGYPLQQCPIWTQLGPRSSKQTYLAFVAREEGDVVAQGLVRLRALGAGLSVAAIQRGPVTTGVDVFPRLLPALERALKKRGAITLTINPPWSGADVPKAKAALEDLGYAQVPPELQNFPTATAALDISRPIEEVQAAMHRKARADLRRAANAGVEARPMASLEEAAAVNVEMEAMAQATGMITDEQHDFRRHFKYLQENPQDGIVLVTTLNGEVFGGLVSYVEGQVGYGFNLCTRPGLRLPRTHVMLFEAVRALQEKGCTRFDLVGYDSGGDAERLGRSQFKKHFNPDIIDVLPIMSKPLRPLPHFAVQALRGVWRQAKSKRKRMAAVRDTADA